MCLLQKYLSPKNGFGYFMEVSEKSEKSKSMIISIWEACIYGAE